jgi:hypothetical protein
LKNLIQRPALYLFIVEDGPRDNKLNSVIEVFL